ncbi:MAG: tol-pal system protein YbgF [Nitrospinota bacterium]
MVITVSLLLSGCTVMRYATIDDIIRLEEEISDVQKSNIAINEMKDKINNIIEMMEERDSKDSLVLDEIRGSIRKVEKRIDDLRMGKEEKAGKKKGYDDISLQPEVPTLFMPNKNNKKTDMSGANNRGKKKVLMASSEPNTMDPDELYQLAYNDFKDEEYDNAIKRFRDFLERYKESDLADNAQYWIGESYYTGRYYKKALLEFKKVIDEYPDGNKIPDALFKYGMSFYELNDLDSALAELRRLVKLYPDSEIVSVAIKKIEMIEGNNEK